MQTPVNAYRHEHMVDCSNISTARCATYLLYVMHQDQFIMYNLHSHHRMCLRLMESSIDKSMQSPMDLYQQQINCEPLQYAYIHTMSYRFISSDGQLCVMIVLLKPTNGFVRFAHHQALSRII